MKKLLSLFLAFCIVVPFISVNNISYAEESDIIKGNAITIDDPVTGKTYHYVNFQGQPLMHTYMGMQAWTTDGKSFVCGVKGEKYHLGLLLLYNTETDEFKVIDYSSVSTSVDAVVGTDNCIYYVSQSNIKRYNIDTGEYETLLRDDLGFSPNSLTVSNDCNYLAFASGTNKEIWAPDDSTAIFRYNIREDKIEHYNHKFSYSNILNHHQINPENPDLVFFVHEGNIGEGEGQVSTYRHVYDRQWSVDFKTGEKRNMFKQGLMYDSENRPQNIVFTAHESWSSSGKYLYMNCYSNSSAYGKSQCGIRCYADGSHREYLRGAATGKLSADHSMATGDDKFTVIDTGKYVYLLSNDTYQQFPIFYSETSRYDPETGTARPHPYHPHPCVARNHYKVLWGMEYGGWGAENGGVVGVGWYDFGELARTIAKGGRYPVNEYIDTVRYTGLDCESKDILYQGKMAQQAGAGKYIFYDVNERVVDGVNETVTITFDYFDNTTNDINLIYTDAFVTDNDYADTEDASIKIKRTGTNRWITKSITLNANFENINPYRTDFKIGSTDSDVCIANIRVEDAPEPSEFYDGGDGTKENPYRIATPEQLKFFSNHVRTTSDKTPVDSNLSYTASMSADTSVSFLYTPERYHVFTDKYFQLTADINMSGDTWTPIGNLINNFNGHFDGNGYVIKNVFINGSTPMPFERYAFFGSTGADVEIKNLGIENLKCLFLGSRTNHTIYVDDMSYKFENRLIGAAGFVSAYAGGTFENCFIKNVEVRDLTEQMGSGGTGAFFGLGYGTVEATEENGFNQMVVKNCFVNGAVLRSHSPSYGFIGINGKPGIGSELAKDSPYRVTRTITNCYTANIERGYYKDNSLGIATKNKTYDGEMKPFAVTTRNITYNNCYTTSSGEKTNVSENEGVYTYESIETEDAILKTVDLGALEAGLVDNLNFYPDPQNVNRGYPIYADMSLPIKWDGVTDKKPEGDGTEESPYLIATKEELLWAKNSVNYISEEGIPNGYSDKSKAYFKLVEDIDFEGNEWEPMGNGKVPFKGHFDGNGHIIKNFRITSYCDEYVSAYKKSTDSSKSTLYLDKIYKYIGFFGKVATGALVENLGIEDARIRYYNHDYYYELEVNEKDVVTNSKQLRATATGGMVGLLSGGKFVNCYVKNSDVKNLKRDIHDFGVGGFVGEVDNASVIIGCYVKDVEFSASFYSSVCGFANDVASDVTITDCYSANLSENLVFANGSIEWRTTIYGFAKAKKGANVTNCYSDLNDFASTSYEPEVYYNEYSMGIVSSILDPLTRDELVGGIIRGGTLVVDNKLNDGYPVCKWELDAIEPFNDYKFFTVKDGISNEGFVSGGTIDTVSFYKKQTASDCYMYTVLYDKADENKMISCSVDYLSDNELTAESTHEIKLSTPLLIPQAETNRYILKVMFFTNKENFAPLCEYFEYSE